MSAVAASEPQALLLRAALRLPVDRVPVWLHRQAGRYLPEFLEVRKRADFFTMVRTPELAAEVTLQPVRRFALDAAIIFSDILVVPQALGLEVVMQAGVGPTFPKPLSGIEDLQRLAQDVDVNAQLGYVFEAIKLTRSKLREEVPLIGFAGGPWTLMAYMIEGEGSKAYNKAKRWLYCHPVESRALLQRLTDVTVEYLVGQVEAGAQLLEVFESHAGDLSPDAFREFSFPFLQQIAARVKAALRDRKLGLVPMTVFPRGAHYSLRWLSHETEYDVISLDWTVSPEFARRETAGRVALQGNLEPAVLYGTDECVREHTRRMIAAFGTQGYIVNLGHGMLPDHEPRAVGTLVDEVHAYSAKLIASDARR